MSRWTATMPAGRVWWAEGSWIAQPPELEEALDAALSEGRCQAMPTCPVFDPDVDLEKALVAVVIAGNGDAEFDEGAPVDEVVPPTPDGAVS